MCFKTRETFIIAHDIIDMNRNRTFKLWFWFCTYRYTKRFPTMRLQDTNWINRFFLLAVDDGLWSLNYISWYNFWIYGFTTKNIRTYISHIWTLAHSIIMYTSATYIILSTRTKCRLGLMSIRKNSLIRRILRMKVMQPGFQHQHDKYKSVKHISYPLNDIWNYLM